MGPRPDLAFVQETTERSLTVITAGDFKIVSIMGTVFFHGGVVNTRLILTKFLEMYTDRLNGQVISIPEEPGMPPELPRVILGSSNNVWNFQVSLIRADVTKRDYKGEVLPGVDDVHAEILPMLEDVIELTGLKAGRLSTVCNQYAATERPAVRLAERFCKNAWLQDGQPLAAPDNFELHVHRRHKLACGLEVNSWIRHKSGFYQIASRPRGDAIVVEQDINTPGESAETATFDAQVRKEFFVEASQELIMALARNYPGGEP